MSIFKRGSVYWYKFMWNGKMVRQSTRQGNAPTPHCAPSYRLFNADKAVRKEGNVFCGPKCANAWGKARTMTTLRSFLEDRFVPDAETRHKAKPMTVRYYRQGADMLKRSRLAELRLDELTDEHAQQFSAEYSRLSPSGINRGLRTLRRALNLAYKWNQLDKPIKVELAKGENQRERVLTDAELVAYLNACPQPWRDVASLISEEGMRPGEVFALRWSHVFIGEDGTGLIRVVEGKSKAARRILPMTPAAHSLLKARHEDQGCPVDGWIFPARSNDEHMTGDNVKEQHSRALDDSRVTPFVPYVLRHTALTRLAKATNGDVFALARIAGHSSITITQRYVHPQADTIEGIFARAVLSQTSHQEKGEEATRNAEVGTKLGTAEGSTKRLLPPNQPK